MEPNLFRNLPPLELPPGTTIGRRRDAYRVPRERMFGQETRYTTFSIPTTPPGTWNPATDLFRLREEDIDPRIIQARKKRAAERQKEKRSAAIRTLEDGIRQLDQQKNRQQITNEQFAKEKIKLEKRIAKLKGTVTDTKSGPTQPKPPKKPPRGGGSGAGMSLSGMMQPGAGIFGLR